MDEEWLDSYLSYPIQKSRMEEEWSDPIQESRMDEEWSNPIQESRIEEEWLYLSEINQESRMKSSEIQKHDKPRIILHCNSLKEASKFAQTLCRKKRKKKPSLELWLIRNTFELPFVKLASNIKTVKPIRKISFGVDLNKSMHMNQRAFSDKNKDLWNKLKIRLLRRTNIEVYDIQIIKDILYTLSDMSRVSTEIAIEIMKCHFSCT